MFIYLLDVREKITYSIVISSQLTRVTENYKIGIITFGKHIK